MYLSVCHSSRGRVARTQGQQMCRSTQDVQVLPYLLRVGRVSLRAMSVLTGRPLLSWLALQP